MSWKPLCLAVVTIVVSACSVDVSKLRAPTASAADGPMERDTEPDAIITPDSGDARDVPGDVPEVPRTDLPGVTDSVNEPASSGRKDAVDLAREAKGGSDAGPEGPARDAADDVDDIVDGGGDVSRGGDGNGVAASGGAGGTGTGGATGSGTGGMGGYDGPSGGTGGTGGAGIDPDLVLWYKFDEGSGTVAADSAGFGTGDRDGKVSVYGSGANTAAAFTTDAQVGSHALSLAPSSGLYGNGGGYVALPSLQPFAPDAITVAIWVKLAVNSRSQNWERIFDFGSGTSATGPYFYMTARASDAANNPVRFGMSRNGNTQTAEQRLEATYALTTDAWHHIAIVLPPTGDATTYTGTLYIDGAVAATNPAMTLHLSDLATTTNNWLGRSQFSEDPFFYGSLDDFRVYKRALSQVEIDGLYALR